MLIHWPTQVEEEEKYRIILTDVPNCFQVHVRHGFNEHVVTQNLSQLIHERLRRFIISGDGMLNNPSDQHDEITRQKLDALEKANKEGVVYIIGKEQLKTNPNASFIRRLALGVFIWLRQISRSKVAEMDFQLADVFEVGVFTQI
jgi:KUP system potassium uptake protein